MSIDPAAQLRHELRPPLNHIIGYAEMLLEELEGRDGLQLAATLSALRTDARQLLTMLNEVLVRGAGPRDLAAARDTLRQPLERVREARQALCRQAGDAGEQALLADLDRIGAATERLEQMLGHGGVPPVSAAAEAVAAGGPAGAATSRGIILVVDDNEDNRDMLARRLRRQGYEC